MYITVGADERVRVNCEVVLVRHERLDTFHVHDKSVLYCTYELKLVKHAYRA